MLGIGVRASKDAIKCALYNAKHQLIKQGTQMLVSVEKDKSYLLKVSLPQGEPPLQFQPLLVGWQQPGLGPPEKIREEFIQKFGLVRKGD